MDANRLGTDRVAWVDYGKGICIVAVVCLYATGYVEGGTGQDSWLRYWVEFARPFRMPDFFFISGLFLSRTIGRPWSTYLDRKVLHFMYFLLVWNTIYFAIEAAIPGRLPADEPLWQLYLWLFIEPFHMLWFIAILPVFFLVTRLTRRVHWAIILTIAGILQIVQPDLPIRQMERFCERYVYFYAGYVFAPLAFTMTAWVAQNRAKAVAILLVWAVIEEMFVLAGISEAPGISLLLGFVGLSAVMATASLLSTWKAMDWLRYLGQNSIVVFLAFYLVMAVGAKALWRIGPDMDAGLQSLLVAAISIYGAVQLFWLVRRTPARFLFRRPQWLRFASGERHPAAAPALGAEQAAAAPHKAT